ncbi:unnamed protein product [Discula destructiva]
MPQTAIKSMALAVLASSGSVLGQSARQIWNFTDYVDIENSVLRSNGHLLFTTLTDPQLYTIDPTAPEPKAEVVAWLPGGITALTGIAEVGNDKFAVTGGVRGSFSYTQETIYTVDFSVATEDNPNATIISTVASLPDAVMLNGMVALPSDPSVLVLADSRLGCLWRVDIETGSVAKAIEDPLMLPTANATKPIGIDGLKISDSYFYFSNVVLANLARVPFYDNGTALVATGETEVVAEFVSDEDWDDFAINGTFAYGAQSPTIFSKVDLETGELTVIADITEISGGPTSVVFKGDGVHAYITTRGDQTSATSGQVFEVTYA